VRAGRRDRHEGPLHARALDRVARIAVAPAGARPGHEINASVASHLDIRQDRGRNSILLKPGRLEPGEWQIHRHPTVSTTSSRTRFPYPNVALIARHHHEWVDGSGYPDRLALKELLPGLKIICLADSFDAMTSDRPYRSALKLKEAVGRIRKGVRVQFDPRVTRAFLEVLRGEVAGEVTSPQIISDSTGAFRAGDGREHRALLGNSGRLTRERARRLDNTAQVL
jgi:hypothetical protein